MHFAEFAQYLAALCAEQVLYKFHSEIKGSHSLTTVLMVCCYLTTGYFTDATT
jgi:hypothetical protein